MMKMVIMFGGGEENGEGEYIHSYSIIMYKNN
jgi:hypothetical protein